MLVLIRRPQESILIGRKIQVKVLRIEDGCVELGIVAPKNVSIDREEIRLRKLAEQRERKP